MIAIRKIAKAVEFGVTTLLFVLIRIYQATISPILGPACRFEPTCSRYMVEAVRKYGLIPGVWKGLRRFSHCHPWHPGGFDPP